MASSGANKKSQGESSESDDFDEVEDVSEGHLVDFSEEDEYEDDTPADSALSSTKNKSPCTQDTQLNLTGVEEVKTSDLYEALSKLSARGPPKEPVRKDSAVELRRELGLTNTAEDSSQSKKNPKKATRRTSKGSRRSSASRSKSSRSGSKKIERAPSSSTIETKSLSSSQTVATRSLERIEKTNDHSRDSESRGFLCYVDLKPDSLVGVSRLEVSESSEDTQKTTGLSDDINEVIAGKEDMLDVSNYHITASTCLTITTALMGTKLRGLIVNSYLLGDSGFGSVASLLERSSMVSLKMKGWNIKNRSRMELSIIGMRHIAASIAMSTTLRELDLSNNGIDSDIIKPLLAVLEYAPFIESLNLSQNPLEAGCVPELRLTLEKNSSLRKLKLQETKFQSENAISILEALLVNRTLKKINIDTRNSYSPKQLGIIGNIVKYNGIVTSLGLVCGSTAVSESSRKKIDAALRANMEESRKPVVGAREETTYLGEINRLDCYSCDLKELTWKFDYTLLTELLVAHNRLTEIFPKIGLLKNLEILHLQHNMITKLPEEIGGCEALRVLNISANCIASLPMSMAQLRSLQFLQASNNQLKKIGPQIRELPQLTVIDFSHNMIEAFPSFVLSSLENLNLDYNQISILPVSIGGFVNLCSFHIRSNKLDNLPNSVCKLTKLQSLTISGNPLSSIPRGIRQRGPRSVLNFLQCEGNSEVISMVKLLVLGPPGSGKTSLLESLFEKETLASALQSWKKKKTSKQKKTEKGDCTIARREWTHDDIIFDTWDFHGDSEIIIPTHQFFNSSNSVYLIPFNVLEDSDMDAWIVPIANQAGKSPLIIIGTFIDEKSCSKDYVTEVLLCLHNRYRDRFPNIVAYMSISNRTRRGIKELRTQLCEIIKQKGFAEHRIPSTNVILSKKLDSYSDYIRQNNQAPVMAYSDFTNLCKTLSLSDDNIAETALFYHNRGKLIYFESSSTEILQENIFLDPQWLVSAFSNVFKYRNVLISEGRLLYRDLPTIWTEPTFPTPFHALLLGLLEHFEILLPLPKRESESQSCIVPSFLPKERPDHVISLWPTFEDHLQNLNRIWEFKYLPSGFFPRLITRTAHLPVTIQAIWKTGMVIRCGEINKAMLEYNPSLFRLKLKLRIGEPNNFTNLLIGSINVFIEGWYQRYLSEVLLPCTHCIMEHSFDPFIFSLSDCELCAARGKRYAHCRGIRPVRIDLLAPDVAMADIEHLDRKEIALKNELGEGSFARVYRALYKEEEVAVKVIKLDGDSPDVTETDEQLRERFVEFRHEVSLMSGLDHPNLVELKGLCLDSDEMLMVTEFLAHGDLYNFLHDEKQRIPWSLRLKISYDVAKGMKFLHTTTPPIIHRDLKTPNILLASIKSNARVCAKVADFGLSSTLVHTISGRNVFNPNWLAPEVMVPGAEYTEKADVYSYGIILWELVTRQVPFEEFNITFSSELENQIIHQNLRPTIPSDVSKPFAKLIRLCWHADPERRPTFTTIVKVLKDMQPDVAPTLRGNLSVVDLRMQVQKKVTPSPSQGTEEDVTKPMTNFMAVSHITLSPKHSGSVKCMRVIDEHVWIGCGDGKICVWSSRTKQMIQELCSTQEGKPSGVNSLIRVRDNVWASQDSALTIWNIKKLELSKKLKGYSYGALLLVGKNIWCATIDAPNVIHVRPRDNYKKIRKTISMGDVSAGCMLIVGDCVWVGTFQNICVYSVKDCSKISEFEGHRGMIHDLILHDEYVWSCSSDKTIRVWTLKGECIHVLEGHGSRVFQLLSHDGNIWSSSWDKTMMIWDPKNFTFLQELVNIHDDAISAIVSVNVSQRPELWSGAWDKTVCVVKLANFSSEQNLEECMMEMETELGEESEVEIVQVDHQRHKKPKTFSRKVTNFITTSK